jgi:hypothetical protein
MPLLLYPREKSPRYPLYVRLGGPEIRSGRYGVKKNPLLLPEIEPFFWAVQSVAYTK